MDHSILARCLRGAGAPAHGDHYDGRGTGHSQRDVAHVSLAAMVADLEAVIDRTGQDKVSLFAQYTSIPHALAYAARHRDRVTGCSRAASQ